MTGGYTTLRNVTYYHVLHFASDGIQLLEILKGCLDCWHAASHSTRRAQSMFLCTLHHQQRCVEKVVLYPYADGVIKGGVLVHITHVIFGTSNARDDFF